MFGIAAIWAALFGEQWLEMDQGRDVAYVIATDL